MKLYYYISMLFLRTLLMFVFVFLFVGITTIKQFLSANDIPTKWANKKEEMDTKDIYQLASKQTVMVVCHN